MKRLNRFAVLMVAVAVIGLATVGAFATDTPPFTVPDTMVPGTVIGSALATLGGYYPAVIAAVVLFAVISGINRFLSRKSRGVSSGN